MAATIRPRGWVPPAAERDDDELAAALDKAPRLPRAQAGFDVKRWQREVEALAEEEERLCEREVMLILR